jgi:iron(III) transport system substrate-binding protein
LKKLIIALLICSMIVGVAFAQASKQTRALIIWSAAAEDEAQALVAKFNEKYPDIKVSVIRAGSGELLTRLNAEQPKPQGDILLGIAKESFDGAYDLFRAYKSVNHNYLGADVKDVAAVPKYYGFSMPLQAFMVNTKLLKEADYPRKWTDLVDPKYKGEIILANPALSGSAYAQLYMTYKLYGEDFAKKLAKAATFTASSTVGPESVARGEYAITATGEGNIAKYIGEGAPVTFVYPEDGTGARFDASGIIANGPNPRSAELWMDFVTSKEAYTLILNTRNRRVVVSDLPGPKYLPALGKIKLIPYDAIEAAEIREDLSGKFSDWMM